MQAIHKPTRYNAPLETILRIPPIPFWPVRPRWQVPWKPRKSGRLRTPFKRQFRDHKKNAKRRGISFLLTFDQWLKIWTDSGHLHESRCKSGQYVMARHGDQGAYEIGNVEIILAGENVGAPTAIQRRVKAYRGHKLSDEHRAKISASKIKWWADRQSSGGNDA